jgi:glycosyltransferase involved in cell wall biosynthesis
MSKPLITVLLCVHNGADCVARAVQSILQQSFTDFELLIVNDGSSDQSGRVLTAFTDRRIRMIDNAANIGLTRSLNVGLRAARGRFVARQDADDWSHPQRLAAQVSALDRNPGTVLVGTQAKLMTTSGRRVPSAEWRKCTTPTAIKWQLLFENPFVHTSVMFRRDIMLGEFGGYNESFQTNQDFELWSRVVRRYQTRNLPEELVVLTDRAGSVSRRYDVEALRQVRKVFLETRNCFLGDRESPAVDLDIFMTVFNQHIFAAIRDVRPFATALDAVLENFVRRHSEAAFDSEIRRHCATLLARVARAVASNPPKGFARVLLATRRFDKRVFHHSLFPVAARVFAGPLWRSLREHGRTPTAVLTREL